MKRLNRIINFILISFSLSLILLSTLIINEITKLDNVILTPLININNKSFTKLTSEEIKKVCSKISDGILKYSLEFLSRMA